MQACNRTVEEGSINVVNRRQWLVSIGLACLKGYSWQFGALTGWSSRAQQRGPVG